MSLVASSLTTSRINLGIVADLVERDPRVLGAHLEGPFLAPSRRGAHDPAHLRNPSRTELDLLLTAARGTLRQVTIAPELPGAVEAIDHFVAAGVRVAVGHTEATVEQTRTAFDHGASLLTHVFNAMPGIQHRAPGPVIAAFEDPRVTVELILDGTHVHPDTARLVFAESPGRVALITDAMAAAGAHDGAYTLGTLKVTVRDGIAHLCGTSTIAGSTLTQDVALRHAITAVRIDPQQAITALTLTPARSLGLDQHLGLLAPGYAADAVLLTPDWRVDTVWVAGALI